MTGKSMRENVKEQTLDESSDDGMEEDGENTMAGLTKCVMMWSGSASHIPALLALWVCSSKLTHIEWAFDSLHLETSFALRRCSNFIV